MWIEGVWIRMRWCVLIASRFADIISTQRTHTMDLRERCVYVCDIETQSTHTNEFVRNVMESVNAQWRARNSRHLTLWLRTRMKKKQTNIVEMSLHCRDEKPTYLSEPLINTIRMEAVLARQYSDFVAIHVSLKANVTCRRLADHLMLALVLISLNIGGCCVRAHRRWRRRLELDCRESPNICLACGPNLLLPTMTRHVRRRARTRDVVQDLKERLCEHDYPVCAILLP